MLAYLAVFYRRPRRDTRVAGKLRGNRRPVGDSLLLFGGRLHRNTASPLPLLAGIMRAVDFSNSPVLALRMRADDSRLVVLNPARYVLLPLANLVTGYSVKAMERKIERGDWQEGKVWKRAPDGHVLIDLQGYQRWVENR